VRGLLGNWQSYRDGVCSTNSGNKKIKKWTIELPDGSKIQQLTFFFSMEGEISPIRVQASGIEYNEIAAYQFFAPNEIPDETFDCCKQKVSDWIQFQGQVIFR